MAFSLCAYGCFLSTNTASTAPTSMIVMIMAITAGTKYVSAVVCGTTVTVDVGCACGSEANAVSAYEP